jgi:signal transduction histidine kinase/CHASE3 domain sensor protein/DNA-binding response OmpR family regulator
MAMVLCLGVGIVAATHVTQSINQLIAGTATARQQVDAAESILAALTDAETAQRGYLLTGRAYYLKPYYDTLGHIDGLLDSLARLSVGVPWLEDDQVRLAIASRNKIAELRRSVAMAQRGDHDAALAEIGMDAGEIYTSEARLLIASIVDRAEAEHTLRANALQHRQSTVTTLLLAGLGAGILLLGAAALTLLWNRARLLRARAGEMREAARLAAAMEHVPDGVAVFDEHNRLAIANARFAPSLGIPPELVRSGTPFQVLADAVTIDPPLLGAGRPMEPLAIEARQGPRSLEIWRGPMPDGGQMLAIADLTRRVAAEEAVRQSQKMEVLGQMTGGIAHDFNNLLQVISANLELLRSRLVQGGAASQIMLKRLDAAASGVARGARLTRHLLAFARRQPLAPEAIEPARLLTGLEDMLRRTTGEAVELDLVVGDDLWLMRADPTQFENALLNLALNARDAMTDADGVAKGRLTVEAANMTLDEAFAASAAELSPGEYVMFAVTDTGAGMSPEQIARAVEPFYTTKIEGRGTGLGLPMVLGFAKQSGGHFQLCSATGKGTTARLYIPRTFAPTTIAAEPQKTEPTLGNAELVLLVEDDAAVRQVAREALLALNYQVVEAERADAALAMIEAGCRPRLILTDVVMPGPLSARQMTARAQALVPGLAVLFTSGYTQNSIVHNGQLDADVTLLSKPWRQDDLARALRAALENPGPRLANRRRVLLVEDEELLRLTTADALAGLGFDVVQTATAAAGLARLHPAPDLLVTDLGLPDRDGMSLVAEIRRMLPGLPVIVASGAARPPAADVVWLGKPYDVHGLRRAVELAFR